MLKSGLTNIYYQQTLNLVNFYIARQYRNKKSPHTNYLNNINYGCLYILCADCGSTKELPHSCKSRICSICGKRHADEWAEKINKEMYAVPYRHIILTVSDRLWQYFEGNADLQKLMLDTAAAVMKEIVKEQNGKDKKAEPGMRKKQTQNTIKYVCANCGAKEEIPEEVLEYFKVYSMKLPSCVPLTKLVCHWTSLMKSHKRLLQNTNKELFQKIFMNCADIQSIYVIPCWHPSSG